MNKKRKEYIKSCEISYVDTVPLGGYTQKIAVEGKKRDLPIVLCLHGGPGAPVPFSVGCRGLFPELTDKFIMVYWDQLGCGINNYPITDDFTIDSFVKMTVDLIKLLKTRFPENKLYLLGISWGSVLTLLSSRAVPELIDGAVVSGQVLSAPMFTDDAFDTIEKSSAPEKHKKFARELRARKNNATVKDGMKLSRIIRKYTDGYENRKTYNPASSKSLVKGLWSSPDYRLKDVLAIMNNGYAKNKSLMTELTKSDFKNILAEITVPYMIFQGETDIVTSTKEITKFIDECKNDKLSYTVLPDTGHFPSISATKEIFGHLEKIII